jgi:hypothetical protein
VDQRNRYWFGYAIPIVGILILTIPIIIASSYAQSNNTSPLQPYTVHSKPYGIDYGDWSGRWWKWALELPKTVNPVSDTTGKDCGQGQQGPVWFLAGTFGGGAVTRECVIPHGKAIFWNPISQECSYAEYPLLKTEKELRDCVKNFQDKVSQIEVTVDGTKIPGIESYRIQSPLININLPQNNVLGLAAQKTTGVSDGVWVLLPPLPAGNHVIHSKGVSVNFGEGGVVNFVADVTYNLKVK